MAAVVNSDNFSDEEWLVQRAQSCIKTDTYAAKAWMITARSLFPKNFNIQGHSAVENHAKSDWSLVLPSSMPAPSNHPNHASMENGLPCYIGKQSLLQNILKLLQFDSSSVFKFCRFQNFPHEPNLWAELQSMLEAMQSDNVDSKSQLLTDIFAAVPTNVQCGMLLCMAKKISDILEQCRLLLLAMRKFPNLVTEQGLTLIETLILSESITNVPSPVNCYRKLLVCDVLPLVLQKCRVSFTSADLYTWMQKAIQFYISYVTQPPSPLECSTAPSSSDILSPTKQSMKKYPLIVGLQEKESQVSDPWGSLFKLIQQISVLLKWDIDPDFFSKPRDYQWQQILILHSRAGQTNQESSYHQILYMTAVVFLNCLYSYISCVDAEIFVSGSAIGLPAPLVLLEGIKTERSNSETKVKKLRPEIQTSSYPHVTASAEIPDSQMIINHFIIAHKCYELLHSNDILQRGFIKLCQNWQSETWSWMAHFQTDMFIYQGLFQDAVSNLQNFQINLSEKMQLRKSLQLASCFHCLGTYSKACELLLDIIGSLKQFSNSDPLTSTHSIEEESKNKKLTPGRQLWLTLCTEIEILSYCIQLLLSCFKEKAFQTPMDDTALGHMIVLLQYDWPKNYAAFAKAVHFIQSRGSFTYNIFFNYVINIDILEEFAFIKTAEGGKVSLDILPISTKAIAQ
ncbi:integrator complex subunit 10 [Octopus bimaculoides]|nr:integrator complex subunit 10 [Octopus bimaculoides]